MNDSTLFSRTLIAARVCIVFALMALLPLWSFGYPETFRLPLFTYVAALLVLLSGVKLDIWLLKRTCVLAFVVAWTWLISRNTFSPLWIAAVGVFIILTEQAIERILRCRGAHAAHVWMKGLEIGLLASLGFLLIDVIGRKLNVEIPFVGTNALASGIFAEPSHFGFTVGPLIGLAFANKQKWKLFLVSTFVALACSPSVSLVSALGFYLLLVAARKYKWLQFGVVLSVLPMLLLLLNWTGATEIRAEKSASAFVWLNTLQRSQDLVQMHPMGVGPFGWVTKEGYDTVDVHDLATYNERDLASSQAFLYASYGYVGIGLYVLYVYWIASRSRSDGLEERLGICILTLLATHEIRWAGVMLSPILPIAIYWMAVRRYRLHSNNLPLLPNRNHHLVSPTGPQRMNGRGNVCAM